MTDFQEVFVCDGHPFPTNALAAIQPAFKGNKIAYAKAIASVSEWLISDVQLVEKGVQSPDVVVLWLSGKLAIPYQIVVAQINFIHFVRKLPESPETVIVPALQLVDLDVHLFRGRPQLAPFLLSAEWFGQIDLLLRRMPLTYCSTRLLAASKQVPLITSNLTSQVNPSSSAIPASALAY
jgi:hypothetical protein